MTSNGDDVFPATVFVSVASGHLTLLAVGQVLQRSLEPAYAEEKQGGGKGFLGQEELSATLSTRNDQFLHTEDSHMNGLTIRRLTPLECERLQGFPDGWTDIPWRGREHAPDGPRYKALGNSMAVPVMRWIGEGIQLVEEAAETTE